MQSKSMSGSLSQTITDGLVQVTRATGARQSEFEAITPAYIRLEFDADTVITAGAGGYIRATFGGLQSGIKLVFTQVFLGMATDGAVVDPVREWYRPLEFPVMFDEDFLITLDTEGFAPASLATVNYTMYYSIDNYTELEMVQTISGY